MPCPDPKDLERYARDGLTLSQRERVAIHLEGCADCRARMVAPALAAETLVPGLKGTSALFLERGTPVGRYVLLEQLGSGGMGVVYAALDPELDRKVALKLLRSQGPEAPERPSEAKVRLLREAQAMARLSHPNVITIYDVGSHGTQVYIAMELVEGVTLTEWLRVKRSWREVVRVFGQAGRGLSAAHEAGLVHRDFKPDNVLVSAEGAVRVMDFGLARSATSEQGERPWRRTDPSSGSDFLHSTLTRKGTVVGTPAYMSPEQFVDDPLDARSDQFSFCVALYEALYGALPFKGGTVKELAIRVMGGQVPRLPPRLRVPLGVHSAVARGLASSPEARHPTMAALVHALERSTLVPRRALAAGALLLLSGVGVVWDVKTASLRQHACLRADRQLANVWDRDSKRAIHQAFSATGVPFAEDAWKGVEHALDGYTSQWIATHDTACEDTWVRKEQPEVVFELRMACLDDRKRELHTLAALFASADAQVVEKSLQAASSLSAIAPCGALDASAPRQALLPTPEEREKLAELRGQLSEASALQGAGVFPKAAGMCRDVVAGARALKDRTLEAEALLLLGRLTSQSGDYAGAEQHLLESFWAAERGRQHELAVKALTELVPVVGQKLGRNQEGRRWGRSAEAMLEGLGNPAELRAQLLANTALVLAAEGQHAEAAERLKEALGLRERLLGTEHVEVATTLQELGTLYRALARYEDALASQRRARPIIERAFGANHPRVARALNHEAIALKSLGRLDEARALLERALSIEEKAFGADAQIPALTINNLASVLEEQGQLDGASAAYQRALEIEEKAPHPNPVRVAAELNNLGDVLLKQGQTARALAHFEKALATRQEALGAEHFDVAKDLLGVGETYLAMKRVPEALPPLEKALKIRESHQGFPTTLARIRFSLAQALWVGKQDRARARQLATQARGTYASAGPGNASELQAVDAWLEQHRG